MTDYSDYTNLNYVKNKSSELMKEYGELSKSCFEGFYDALMRKEFSILNEEALDEYIKSLFIKENDLYIDEKVRYAYAVYVSGFMTAKMIGENEDE